MNEILAFAGSNSSTSINFKLVKYTTSIIDSVEVRLLNMTEWPLPMYSEDAEREQGFSESLKELKGIIGQAGGLILSVNEHNSAPSAYFKNLMDWLLRLERNFLIDTKILLMSTSGGKRGAMSSLEIIKNVFPRFGGEVVASFSLPSFYGNFNEGKGIMDENLALQHKEALDIFLSER